MFSVTGNLAVMPIDPTAVCGLISSFLEGWNVMPLGLGIPRFETEVSESERRLGFAMPAALRWMFTHVGIDNTVVGRQDPLVHPRRLEIDDEGVLVYRVENQNCAKWGFRVGGVGNPDPPVVWKDLQTNAEWRPYQQRLSVDLLEMTFNEVMLLPGAHLLQTELPSGVPSELDGLPRLAIPSHVFWAIPEGPPVQWYGMQNCLVRKDGDAWLWAFGRTADDVERAAETIPGEWIGLRE